MGTGALVAVNDRAGIAHSMRADVLHFGRTTCRSGAAAGIVGIVVVVRAITAASDPGAAAAELARRLTPAT
jgi:thiamine-phosphate pyrophosphorylase